MTMNTDQQTLAKGLSRRAAEPALLSHQLPELIELTETQLDAIEGGGLAGSVARWIAENLAWGAVAAAASAALSAAEGAAKGVARKTGGNPASRRG